MGIVAEYIIQLAEIFRVPKRRVIRSREAGEVSRKDHCILEILLRMLDIGKEKELVLNDRPTHVAPGLVALVRNGLAAGEFGKSRRLVAEKVGALAMQAVAARFAGDAHRSRRGERRR